jgi:hypothetical protein
VRCKCTLKKFEWPQIEPRRRKHCPCRYHTRRGGTHHLLKEYDCTVRIATHRGDQVIIHESVARVKVPLARDSRYTRLISLNGAFQIDIPLAQGRLLLMSDEQYWNSELSSGATCQCQVNPSFIFSNNVRPAVSSKPLVSEALFGIVLSG